MKKAEGLAKVKITVRLPLDLYLKLAEAVYMRGLKDRKITQQSIVIQALERELAKGRKP